jgi:hypothetical protein
MNTTRLRSWIQTHDESWLFIVAYIGLAVVLSIWISLFWLVAVVAAHLLLELLRQRHLHRGRLLPVAESLWELKLDVALVFFALVLSLYMDVVLGLVGLQAAARVSGAARVATRFAGWERTLRGVVLSADDAVQVARAVTLRRGGGVQEVEVEVEMGAGVLAVAGPGRPAGPWGRWVGPWGRGDWIAMGVGGTCLLLLVLSPLLTDHTPATALLRLRDELRMFP